MHRRRSGWPDDHFPADPYPGAVPPVSFVHVDGVTYPLGGDGWAGRRVGRVDLDDWLARHGAPPADRRVPVLAYGSNRCPSKITWLRRALGLGPEPVVVLRARTSGAAAVWAAGLRHRDGQRPAVLAAAPGVTEDHAVWLATPEQIAVLDRCEGRDDRFRLARFRTARPVENEVVAGSSPEERPRVRRGVEVRTEDGAHITEPWCYLGLSVIRRPLLVGGHSVRCMDVPQAAARDLVGEPGPGDGLDAETVVGAPHPDEWPAALFTYGLLRPGQPSWDLVAPHASGVPRPVRVPGTVLDTGRGYPAWLPAGPGETPGAVVPLRDPTALFPALDVYEGSDYQRIRTAVPADGTVCWAYAWRSPSLGFAALPSGWPP